MSAGRPGGATALPSTAFILLTVVMLAGCRKPSPPPTSPIKPRSAGGPLRTVVSGGGDITNTNTPDHHALWHVEYENVELHTVGETLSGGLMKSVKGQIYQQGDDKSFRADQAVGDRISNVLTLTGHVSVYSEKKGANLKCDKLIYEANRKLFMATGHVSLLSKNADIVNVPAAVAMSDFSEVSSPDMSSEKNALPH